MTEYNEGDLVEAVKGPTIIRSVIVNADNDAAIGNWALVKWFEDEGFTLTVIEKAAPKNVLPTEAGYYVDYEDDVWRARLNDHGDLEWFLGLTFIPAARVVANAPFTRLEPVPVTAKRVLDEVHGIFGLNSLARDEVERIGAQVFGVKVAQ